MKSLPTIFLALPALAVFFVLAPINKKATLTNHPSKPLITEATGTIKGAVTDAETGEKILFATLYVPEADKGTSTDEEGNYQVELPPGKYSLQVKFLGYEEKVIKNIIVEMGKETTVDVALKPGVPYPEEVVVQNQQPQLKIKSSSVDADYHRSGSGTFHFADEPSHNWNTESYSHIEENNFKTTIGNPLATFSIDVDNASYSNVRRFINQSQEPPKDAVRVEEMVNYFTYDYKEPADEKPFAVFTELSDCPWNEGNQLLHVGLQAKKVDYSELAPSNLVFLLDVSGSMNSPQKLPLVKKSMQLLINNLSSKDRVAIVVYAGAAGLVLPSTPANQTEKIFAAIDQLSAGGSTAGGAGIKLAYKVARENFITGGNNRIILCTDGDFNIGVSSDGEMTRLVEEERKSGVFLTVCGFGMGNYKDSKMEAIADYGNGNYYYLDNIMESEKVFGRDLKGTLFTVAKDVKIQIEFNPAKVESYRLIGYENRVLNKEDFADDKKDAGELGAGHTVTALFEIVPADGKPGKEDLKYQTSEVKNSAKNSDELMEVHLRYKEPDGEVSKLVTYPVKYDDKSLSITSDNFRWSAAVAAFGMLLRDSEFKGSSSHDLVLSLAKDAVGEDEFGERGEFLRLVRTSQKLVVGR